MCVLFAGYPATGTAQPHPTCMTFSTVSLMTCAMLFSVHHSHVFPHVKASSQTEAVLLKDESNSTAIELYVSVKNVKVTSLKYKHFMYGMPTYYVLRSSFWGQLYPSNLQAVNMKSNCFKRDITCVFFLKLRARVSKFPHSL